VVYKCATCGKLYTSFNGLKQHQVVHSDEKKFACEYCGKAFKFKGNMQQHRKLHEGFTPYPCPMCDKVIRLAGNLAKHIRSLHCNDDEAHFKEVWDAFKTKYEIKKVKPRRSIKEVPETAVVVRADGERLIDRAIRPPKRHRLGMDTSAESWVEKILRGDLFPTASIEAKMEYVADILEPMKARKSPMEEVLEAIAAVPFEHFECTFCKQMFWSRHEYAAHIEAEHQQVRDIAENPPKDHSEKSLFCAICQRAFDTYEAMDQHESYHERVRYMLEAVIKPKALESVIIEPKDDAGAVNIETKDPETVIIEPTDAESVFMDAE